jgi:hypothetical protein
MTRSLFYLTALACICASTITACGGDDDTSTGNPIGSGGAKAAGASGGGAAGTTTGTGGATTAGGSGGSSAGGAGMGMAANMPDATCKAGASGINAACDNCSCTPDAMGGCLTEIAACQGSTDMMTAMLCKALVDCCVKNNVTGMACATPCMNEVSAAFMYMSGAPVNAATALGNCSSMKCAAVCPH